MRIRITKGTSADVDRFASGLVAPIVLTGELLRGTVAGMKSPESLLAEIASKGLFRQLSVADCEAHGLAVGADGERLVNFASNDYLGLAHHPGIMEAFIEGIKRYGAGSMASRLVTGTRTAHTELEEALAGMKGTEAALSFSSGYATSVGLLPCIVGKGDVVILDKLSHASLIDGAKLSGARIMTFLHNDPASLDRKLAAAAKEAPSGTVLVVTESVFSMDGDRAPLRELVEVKNRHGALLLVDEAHAFGLIGPSGKGLAAELGVSGGIEFQMGTLSKSVGLSGGYVACSRAWVDLFVNRSRSFIYSTAPPPAIATAALSALELIRGAEGEERRARLHRLHDVLTKGMGGGPREFSAIFPWIIGGSDEALAAADALKKRGFLVPAIRYPTVPAGTARLRMTLTADHDEEQVVALACAVHSLL